MLPHIGVLKIESYLRVSVLYECGKWASEFLKLDSASSILSGLLPSLYTARTPRTSSFQHKQNNRTILFWERPSHISFDQGFPKDFLNGNLDNRNKKTSMTNLEKIENWEPEMHNFGSQGKPWFIQLLSQHGIIVKMLDHWLGYMMLDITFCLSYKLARHFQKALWPL